MKNVRTDRAIPHADYFPQPPSANGPARWLAVVLEDARELVKFWPVAQNMVVQDLRVRYHRSVLGFFWTLLNPILMMTTLTFVFSQVFAINNWRQYAIYLFAGQVPWALFSGVINDCAVSIVGNENLIRKIYLPKLIFPLVKVLLNLVTFVLSLTALFFLAGPLGARFTAPMLGLPAVILLFSAFSMGLGLILATANTFFRDSGHMIGVVMQAWYFATPVIWGQEGLPPALEARCWLNPAFPYIQMFHVIISDGQWPDLSLFLAAALYATVSLGIGYATFKCHESKLVFRL
ncbi:ABC transporter permease [Tundrisphaera sp. TA3]|uniref:ABC transporter permease n=1 Tax=Tundrisphaera sp. TA3 TaxID=3435775 RepID=UPI003EB9A2F4